MNMCLPEIKYRLMNELSEVEGIKQHPLYLIAQYQTTVGRIVWLNVGVQSRFKITGNRTARRN